MYEVPTAPQASKYLQASDNKIFWKDSITMKVKKDIKVHFIFTPKKQGGVELV